MPATLQQIQAKLAEATALRDDAEENLRLLALTEGSLSSETRCKLTAKLNGYTREVEALLKCERDLIANGRLDAETARLAESRFNASEAAGALITLPHSSDAELAPREAPRSEAAESAAPNAPPGNATPLPAAGDVF